MKLPYARSGRAPTFVSQFKAAVARKISPAAAWGAGLAFVGGAAVLAISLSPKGWNGLGAFLFAATESTPAVPMGDLSDSDGTLVRAVYSAGMVQDLGTFGGYKNAATGKSSSDAVASDSFSSGRGSDIVSLYSSGGGGRAFGSSFNASGEILTGLGLVPAYNSQSFRSTNGLLTGWSGGGGARGQANSAGHAGRSGSSAGGAGNAGLASSGNGTAGLEANSSVAAGGNDDGGQLAEASVAAAANDQVALVSDGVLISAGVAAGIPGILSAQGITNPDGDLGTAQSDALLDTDARVPEIAATWALFVAALAGLAGFRRIFV